MDGITIIKAVILGVVEGLTEFLPVSSTGHLILAGDMLSVAGEKAKLFEVFIQLGAILAVVWVYRIKLIEIVAGLKNNPQSRRLFYGITVAFFPAALVGLVTHKYIKQYLFSPVTVSVALIAGGAAIILIEKMNHKKTFSALEQVGVKPAFWVGVAQIAALFPGISRSGATIMGGLLAGLDSKTAAEFSFFLAIPTMFAATVFDLSKSAGLLSAGDLKVLLTGFAAAFISSIFVVRWLIRFISHHNFIPFAYYRIIFGSILLAVYLF